MSGTDTDSGALAPRGATFDAATGSAWVCANCGRKEAAERLGRGVQIPLGWSVTPAGRVSCVFCAGVEADG